MNLLKRNIKRIVSSLLILALVFSIMIPLTDITVEAAEKDAYTVNVRIEGKDSTFVTPKKLTIDNLDLSDYSGIEKSFEGLKPIHAIVKGLEVGDIDPKEESNFSSSGGFITMVNGLEGGWMYTVDNIDPDVGAEEYELKNGQNVVLYFVETWDGNAYSYFDRKTIGVEANEEFKIKLNGSAFDPTDAPNGIIEGATILVDDQPYQEDGNFVKTDSNGEIALKLKEDGIYHISAEKKNEAGENIISRPYVNVMVEESTEETVNIIESIASVDNIKVDLNLSEEKAIAKLPKNTEIVDSEGNKHIVNLRWTVKDYSSAKAGEYNAAATFTLPEGVEQTDPETFLTVSTKIIVEKSVNIGSKEVNEAVEKTVNYYMENNPNNPVGDWEAYVGLWGLDKKINKEYDWEAIDPGFGEDIGDNDAITYSYALLSQGQDPSNIWGGRNLFSELAGQQRESGVFTNIGKHSFAILLLDAGEKMGADVGVWNDTNRQIAIDKLLEMQNKDGSFGTFSYLDHTAMSLIALSRYSDQEEVAGSIDDAFDFLKSKQTETGGFDYNEGFEKGEDANSIAVIIQALVALDEDLLNAEGEWAKGGNTPVDALLKYQNKDGSFLWKLGTTITGPATKQALVALSDIKNGSSTWHRMGEEVYLDSVGEKDVEELVSNIEKLPMKDKISYDDKNIIMKAYNKYISLPEEYKAKVTNSDKLLEAKATLDKIEKNINYINDGIWDLPGKAEDIRLKHKDQIIKLLEKYEALSDKDKKYVEYYSELLAAKEQIDKLEKDSVVVIPGVDNTEGDNTENINGENVDIKDAGSTDGSSPKTGDKGITIPIVLAILSAIILGILSKKRKII